MLFDLPARRWPDVTRVYLNLRTAVFVKIGKLKSQIPSVLVPEIRSVQKRLSSSAVGDLDAMQNARNNVTGDLNIELKLVKRLIRLSKVCWSPTLRENVEVIEALGRELRAADVSRRKNK